MNITTSENQASFVELFVVLGLAFGSSIVISLQTFVHSVIQLPGNGQPIIYTDAAFIDLISFEIVVGLLCFTLLAARGWTLDDFDLRPTWKLTAIGFLLVGIDYVLYNAAYAFIELILGTQALNAVAFEYQVSLVVATLLSIVNPVFEEVLVVGYAIPVMEQLSNVRGAIAFSTLFRLLYHLYQGPIAFASILPLGLMFAFVYWRWRKLWPLIVAHAALDFIPLVWG
jgi:uncharacterized protein